jgi:hypothetical protein
MLGSAGKQKPANRTQHPKILRFFVSLRMTAVMHEGGEVGTEIERRTNHFWKI